LKHTRKDTKDKNLISGKPIFKNEVFLEDHDDRIEVLCYLRQMYPKAFIQIAEDRFFWFEEGE